jgi:cation diffusion facilitator family transporter
MMIVLKNKKIRAALITFCISVVLLSVKFFAYRLSDSKAILSDALESIVNVVAAISLCFVTYISALPPDDNHPYGHGKIEYLSSAFEGGAILFAGLLIIIDATQSFFGTIVLKQMNLALILIAIAGLINGLTGFLLKRSGAKNNSPALKASGTHLLSDFWTSVGILVGLVVVKITGILILDPIIALLVAFHLCREGLTILTNSGSNLMDAEDKSLLKSLVAIFNKHYKAGIIQIHSTRIIRSGDYHHIDIHITVPEFWSVQKGHDFIADFEAKVFQDYRYNGELHFHLDPCRENFCSSCELSDCPVRAEQLTERKEFSLQSITAPDHPEDQHQI